MTLKTLVTGVGVATLVGAAAAGVTSVASSTVSASPAVQSVVFGVPMPAAPADLQGALLRTLDALASGGSFYGKQAYIQGGIRRIEAITADKAYNNAAAEGLFPLSFDVRDIVDNGGVATANVTATAANGASAVRSVTFIAGPSPTGWQISKPSALALLSSVG